MIKVLATDVLIIISAALIFGMAILNIPTLDNLNGVDIKSMIRVVVSIALMSAVIFGIDRVRPLFRKKLGFTDRKFVILAYGTSAIAAAVFYSIIDMLNGIHGFSVAAVFDNISGVWLITSIAVVLLGVLMTGLFMNIK